MTWKEFKDLVEAACVKDDDSIWYIDVNGDSRTITADQGEGVGSGWAIGD